MHFIFVVSFVILASSVLDTQGLNPNCTLPWDDGPCRARIPSFYFDHVTKKCHVFMYGGCGGNGNNFETQEECLEKCRE
uniref:BPTI/Kunitz inhibitor domain-containing protein n=1 Tax=Ixodes ricinus TaxID=34613 RepID=V5GQ85_IXORI